MYGNHRRIVTYKIFINKQLKHTNVTIRLALYIYINVTAQSKLGSSRAMLASDVWIEKLAVKVLDAHQYFHCLI